MTRTRLISISAVLIIAGLAGFLILNKYWNSGGDEAREAYVRAMTEDTYGGETPEETLALFVAALEARNVELAHKYFSLDENLSREKWLKTLAIFKENNLLGDMAADVNIDSTKMEFNTYSGVWKIKDF